jgi:sporulation protein YlmC with PRC-barrel domain
MGTKVGHRDYLGITLSERRSKMPTATGHTDAIPASRVIGTDVYNTAGEHIGEIQDVMLEKTSNGIMFAVVGFGGFLGIGEKYHAIPWASLDYDAQNRGYVVPYSKEELRAAPSYSVNELTEDDGMKVRNASYDYYKADPYWQ